MTKDEIVSQIAERTGMEKAAAKAAVDTFCDVVSDAIVAGDSVYIRGFATLSRIRRAPKAARNIGCGTEIRLPARFTPHAKFSRKLAERMPKPE